MSRGDPLEGYRGTDPDAEAVERGLRERMGPENGHLVDQLTLGLVMEQFITENLAGRHLFERAQEQLAESLNRLTETSDLTSKAAIDAHYDARVANTIVSWIQQAIMAGKEAEKTITSNVEGGTPS